MSTTAIRMAPTPSLIGALTPSVHLKAYVKGFQEQKTDLS